jgi:Zn-dependent protease
MDDKRTPGSPERRDGYTYQSFWPDGQKEARRDAPIDVPFRVASGSNEPPRADEGGAPPPPVWGWPNNAAGATQGSGAAGGSWIPPVASPDDPWKQDSPHRDAGQQQPALIRWLQRGWPLLLLGLSKLKWLAVLFKFKVFTTFGSMLLSLAAYAIFFGWQFAAGFIVLLLIHELGHAAVMRFQGIRTSPIVFVPFMGAVIGMREMPKNAFAEAQMALGGPILGTIGALGALGLWQVTGNPLFVALTYFGFFLNLFNLLPVSPLDGGRAMAAISRWGWLIGLALLLLLFLKVHSLIMGIILIVGGIEVYKRWRGQVEERAYYEVTWQQRLIVSGVYFGLAGLLAFGMFYLQAHLLINQPGL